MQPTVGLSASALPDRQRLTTLTARCALSPRRLIAAVIPPTLLLDIFVELNSHHLIRLPIEDSKANYLDGFWRWVGFLADDNYQRGLESLYWSHELSWTPDILKERVTTFFGGNAPWSVVIPNERLVNVINGNAEYDPRNKQGRGWLRAQIPLTTQPEDPKHDKLPLMGLATSFFIREYERRYVLEFEIFHA